MENQASGGLESGEDNNRRWSAVAWHVRLGRTIGDNFHNHLEIWPDSRNKTIGANYNRLFHRLRTLRFCYNWPMGHRLYTPNVRICARSSHLAPCRRLCHTGRLWSRLCRTRRKSRPLPSCRAGRCCRCSVLCLSRSSPVASPPHNSNINNVRVKRKVVDIQHKPRHASAMVCILDTIRVVQLYVKYTRDNHIQLRQRVLYLTYTMDWLWMCSWRGRHSYMTRMYADKNIQIVFHVAGSGVNNST